MAAKRDLPQEALRARAHILRNAAGPREKRAMLDLLGRPGYRVRAVANGLIIYAPGRRPTPLRWTADLAAIQAAATPRGETK